MNEKLKAAIEAGLRAYPTLRVGQLLVNVCDGSVSNAADLYYKSDESLADAIYDWMTCMAGKAALERQANVQKEKGTAKPSR